VPAATNWAGGRVEAGGASGPRPGGRHRRGGGCARRARLLGRRPRGRRAAAAGRPGGPRRGQPAGGERAGSRLRGRALCRPAGVSGLPLAAQAAAAPAAGRGQPAAGERAGACARLRPCCGRERERAALPCSARSERTDAFDSLKLFCSLCPPSACICHACMCGPMGTLITCVATVSGCSL